MIQRFLTGVVFLALGGGACFGQVDGMQLVTPSAGWVVSGGRLLRTDNGGGDWSDITPPGITGQGIEGAFFLDAMRG